MDDLIHSEKGLFIVTIIAVMAAWGGMIDGGYISDDWAWLERAAGGTVLRDGKFFRPVCWLTWLITPLHYPSVSHALDLFVHWLCSCAVGLLVVNLGGSWIAGIGAGIIFATAPTLNEAVCWSSARCGPFSLCLVLLAMNLALQGSRWAVIPIVFVALGVKEPALFAMWGLPLVLWAGKAIRSAIRCALICMVFLILYFIIIRMTGAFLDIGGGYAAPFRLSRSLHHLGAYLGMIVGVPKTTWLWPLWIVLGIVSIIPLSRNSRLPVMLWTWQSILFTPFIRLGGPEQARFLYPLSIVPLIGVAVFLDRTRRFSHLVRMVTVTFVLIFMVSNIVYSRRISQDWLKASRISDIVIRKSLQRLEPDRPHIVINQPEFLGEAHIFRNGFFESLRLVSGNDSYRGVTIAPSEGVVTAGELQRWLENRASELMNNDRTVAWLFRDNRPLPLKGWRLREHVNTPLERLVDPR